VLIVVSSFVVLNISRSGHDEKPNVIDSTRSKAVCRAGPWTVIASKRSEPPATLRVVVTFNSAFR
jgi:hypothetical protein